MLSRVIANFGDSDADRRARAMSEPSVGLITDLTFNYLVDWLSPAEFDGTAHLKLPQDDPRIKATALLAWEAKNACGRAAAILAPMRSFLVSVSARDKLARFVQYCLRFLQGVLTMIAPQKRHALIQQIRKIQLNLSSARRAFRVVEVGPLLTLARMPTVLSEEPFWISRLIGSAATAGFNLFDRARWLQDHGLLPSGPNHSRSAARMICLAQLAIATRLLLHASKTAEARRISNSLRAWLRPNAPVAMVGGHVQASVERMNGLNNGEHGEHDAATDGGATLAEEEDAAEFWRCMRDAAKRLLSFWHAGHAGRVPLLITNDLWANFIGAATTADDLREMWEGRA